MMLWRLYFPTMDGIDVGVRLSPLGAGSNVAGTAAGLGGAGAAAARV